MLATAQPPALHLGTTPWNFDDFSAAALGRQAALAEQLGYQSFWLPENHFNAQAIPDPLMLLAACAGLTNRIALATTSYLLTLRNALQAAEQVAVLDQLSQGRVILGVGRGYAPTMLAAFKVVTKDKRRIFEDCLNEMILAWSGSKMRVTTAGAVETPAGTVALGPLPVQKPHPPLWIAAFGPKALTQAGRLGLPYLASPMETLAELHDNLGVYRKSYEETWTGRDAARVAVQQTVPIMRSVFVCDDRRILKTVREAMSQARGGPSGQAPAPADEWALVGDVSEVADGIAAYRAALGMTHLIASRPRVRGLESALLEGSATQLAELCAANFSAA